MFSVIAGGTLWLLESGCVFPTWVGMWLEVGRAAAHRGSTVTASTYCCFQGSYLLLCGWTQLEPQGLSPRNNTSCPFLGGKRRCTFVSCLSDESTFSSLRPDHLVASVLKDLRIRKVESHCFRVSNLFSLLSLFSKAASKCEVKV